MSNPFRRLKPSAVTLTALLGLAWALTFGAVRDFVWADLRAGMIDLRGLSRATRSLIVLGFCLMAAMIAALLGNDFWRGVFDLAPFTNAAVGRGTLAPLALLPVTLFMLSLAWSFGLAGALHSHWAIRLGVLALYSVVSITWIGNAASPANTGWGLAALAATLLFFAVRWRGRARVEIEFPILLILVALTFLAPQALEVEQWRSGGIPFMPMKVNAHVETLSTLAIPLLMLVGLSMANFTWQCATWGVDIARARLPGWVVYAALGAALLLRLCNVAAAALDALARAPGREALAFLGALGVPACVGAAWLMTTLAARRAGKPAPPAVGDILAGAGKAALVLIIAYLVVQLYTFVLLDLTMALATNFPIVEASQTVQRLVSVYATFLNDQYTPAWRVVVYLLAAGAGIWQARRGRRALALYLSTFGLVALWLEMADFGRLLSFLTWLGPAYVDFWWVVIFAVTALAWLARRRLTLERAAGLLLVVLISGLLRQTGFINNRFTPFFGFAGVAFLAFGLVWDALTAGWWANVDTPELPRVNRIFLYIGYVLLTITLVNWALTTHNLGASARLTGDVAVFGLDRFGKPMLYAVYAAVLAAAPSGIKEPA